MFKKHRSTLKSKPLKGKVIIADVYAGYHAKEGLKRVGAAVAWVQKKSKSWVKL